MRDARNDRRLFSVTLFTSLSTWNPLFQVLFTFHPSDQQLNPFSLHGFDRVGYVLSEWHFQLEEKKIQNDFVKMLLRIGLS